MHYTVGDPPTMTNKVRELFDFAQSEPIAISDMAAQLREMRDEEVRHVEQVANNLLEAIGNLSSADEFAERTSDDAGVNG